MRKWVIVTIILVIIGILIIGILGFYFYNKYSEEIGKLREIKGDADILFSQGIVGPNNCSSFFSCVNYCRLNEDLCFQFCKENTNNELCKLAISLFINESLNNQSNKSYLERGDSIKTHQCFSDEDCVKFLSSCPYGNCAYTCKAKQDIKNETCTPGCNETMAHYKNLECRCVGDDIYDFKLCRGNYNETEW